MHRRDDPTLGLAVLQDIESPLPITLGSITLQPFVELVDRFDVAPSVLHPHPSHVEYLRVFACGRIKNLQSLPGLLVLRRNLADTGEDFGGLVRPSALRRWAA